MLGTAYLKFS